MMKHLKECEKTDCIGFILSKLSGGKHAIIYYVLSAHGARWDYNFTCVISPDCQRNHNKRSLSVLVLIDLLNKLSQTESNVIIIFSLLS